MGSPNLKELELLYQYAKECRFIIETGAGGESTKWLAKAALKSNAYFISIEADPNRKINVEEKLAEVINHKYGWSMTFDDIIKERDPLFVKSRYNTIDAKIAFGQKDVITGKDDLIRKSIEEHNAQLDFFFCDTGEYCGIAEWNIVKDRIKQGGYFVAHDIYYPKSIKCFQVCRMIEESNEWDVVEKTKSPQGLLVARRIK